MRGVPRRINYQRFRCKTLLSFILVLNVALFVVFNGIVILYREPLDRDSTDFEFQVLKSEKSRENHCSEEIEENLVFSKDKITPPDKDETETLPINVRDYNDDNDDDDKKGDANDVEIDDDERSKENDNDEGDNDEGDNDEGDNDEGDNDEGDNDAGDNDEGDNDEGDSHGEIEEEQQQINVKEEYEEIATVSYNTPQNKPLEQEKGGIEGKGDKGEEEEEDDTQRIYLGGQPSFALDQNAIIPSHSPTVGNVYPPTTKSSNYIPLNAEITTTEEDHPPVNKLAFATAEPMTQEILDRIAEDMEVRFEVLEDIKKAKVTLRNKGMKPINANRWSIHFCVTTGMEHRHLVHKPEGYVLPNQTSIKLTHFNGCAYKLEPTKDFKAILPGNSLEFTVNIGPTIARSDLGPRWYVAAVGLQSKVISNTAGESLDFVLLSRGKRPWDRFRHNDVEDLGTAPLLVIPTPLEILGLNVSRKIHIDNEWIVVGELGLENEAKFLADKLRLQKFLSPTNDRRVIKLWRNETQFKRTDDEGKTSNQASSESYQLTVDATEELITITGIGNAGVFYGIQTLLALVDDQGLVPQVSIEDSPRFPYRGLMVDVARNFQPKQEIMKLLDVMAMYKMNKFHFHLSDNEGWRLEIPGIQELTLVGGKRCYDEKERTCILSQFGSGPDTTTSGTGHYSTEDYGEILRHATQLHIQVIPEFDFPGHSHAAIKSMLSRHDRLLQEGKEKEARMYLLNDFRDESRYLSVQAFTDETASVCLNSTYDLMEYVLRMLVSLHSDIQPLTVFHFGGDEVPGGAWQKSPECEKLAETLNIRYHTPQTHRLLKGYFLKRISNITAKMGIELAGWGDFLFERKNRTVLPREFFFNKEVYSFAWSTTGASRNNREVSSMANHGYKVVLSNPDYIYLDHPYEPNQDERGKYWATPYSDTRKIFSFMPDSLYEDIDQIRNCTKLKGFVDGRRNVLGVEAAVWGETIRTSDQMFGMLFPRLIALAERAWHKAPWENISNRQVQDREKAGDWVKFANTLGYRELGRLDKMNVRYHMTPPGARLVGKRLEARAMLPGLRVEYSTDKGVTWNDVTFETEVDGRVKLRTRSTDNKTVSREIELQQTTPTQAPKAETKIGGNTESKREQEIENNHMNVNDNDTKGSDNDNEGNEGNNSDKEPDRDIREKESDNETDNLNNEGNNSL
ncbi:uncharacterized protein LOC111336384 [Stylophora pistillata]|uniref:uncharacterized protein LOC111336384 n=1 Tax=Stylophora pistillata TaxID=50429 RepID=UPI000C045B82|nr:uncharacterized protein LOC111336384 [Stylophora pistillata]